MFHVRRRPTDSQPRRRKKKAGAGAGSARPGNEPMLLEVAPDGSTLENGRRLRITELVEVGSGNGTALQLYGPSIQPRHCVLAPAEGGGYSVTPLHADAHVYVNGRRTMHTQRLQHGCLLKFGRVSTFRFVDPAQENLMNRNLSQSQHFDSGSIYDRSPTSGGETSGAMSPTSLASHPPDPYDSNANADPDYRPGTPGSHDTYGYNANDTIPPYNNNTLKLDNESMMLSQHFNDSKDDYLKDEHSGSVYNDQDHSATPSRLANSQYKDNYETTFDLDGNVETKSICSAKSGGSGHDSRLNAAALGARPGQEAILPAVLEFPEAGQAQFLAAVITRLDPHAPAFKLAPVYTLYLCARYRASTHYRPELTPTERAHKLTAFLHHVATLIHATVQERCTDSAAQAFWMANASELLHFLKCDRHISSFSTQAQELLPTTVQNAFSNLVSCFQEELSRALSELTSAAGADATDATAPTLRTLAAAMVLLRRCRVNAALTIQLFSHLFHYINAVCFNKLVTEQGSVNARWGAALSARLALLAAWAERQGLELAADCHLARTHQAARLIQGEYRTAEEVIAALEGCCKLNSVQVRALLTPLASSDVVEAAVAHTRAHADELYRADGREIRLEESSWLGAALLIPGDGFSAEVVRGVPPGLAEFVAPLQRGGLCRLAHQPHALGLWTVYLAARARRPALDAAAPRVAIVTLHKNANGMGLSIVAAKGAGQSKLGIYIKSVVPGGAAAADGRLAAGDQLLSVDGHSLVGITQEKAAEYLVRTGPTVTLEVAKQGAVLHGLATLLHQPTYNQRQEEGEEEVLYEDRVRRNAGKSINPHPALLRPASPRSELATAGYGRRPFHNRCRLLRDESTESSTDESEELRPHYHGSIPRLIITLDRENEQLQNDLSPETPSCPLELRTGPPPTRQIPIFTFTCEDTDDKRKDDSNSIQRDTYVPHEVPPVVPDPPAYYEQSSENGEPICLPPQMKPIDTKLTLDLFNSRCKENEPYRRRCTGIDECVSACECCRSPQPETHQIPFIDEPNSEPVIFEHDTFVPDSEVPTPKIRRILPSLSLDQSEESKPETADATCQTSSSPSLLEPESQLMPSETPLHRKLELSLNLKDETTNIENMHCRLKRALFNMSRSLSSKSEDTEALSTFSTCESFNEEPVNKKQICVSNAVENNGTKQILDSVDRKSWKSPDEYRPAFGKVKALAQHFNSMNLRYCVKTYKRNCQSSPNLSTRPDVGLKIKDSLPLSASLADILYDRTTTETSESKTGKMSEDQVKSIMIQLEDWSQFGSRGSEDTLAQGNEFELPNLPAEEQCDIYVSTGNYVFNEILDKKPRPIMLDTITLKCSQPSVTSEQRSGAASCPDVSACADISSPSGGPGGPGGAGGAGALRRASERDLPARLAAEPVKPSKSTPALHHAAALGHHHAPHSPHAAHHPHHPQAPPVGGGGGVASRSVGAVGAAGDASSWAHKSRSSHNLAAHQPDAFYQNLPAAHSQHRWSSLRSSNGSNRPQSAHFSAAAEAPADTTGTLHNQINQSSAASVRAAKLAEMSEEVTRRQQQQQHQQQLHQQQMQQQHQLQQQQHQLQQQQLASQQMHVHAGHYQPHQSPQLPPHQHQHQQYTQSPQQAYHNQQQQHQPHQHQPQRYDWHPPGPPSPQRSQPPVAPKPLGARKSDTELEEQLLLQQQQMINNSTIQPDDERYVASASDPPAVAMYAAGGAAGAAGAGRVPAAHNPWQREERERQVEARRAQARARRDAAIAQLVALGSARSAAQNQQLRALQLERDFERRATQHEHDDGGNAEAEPDEEDSSPPPSPPATSTLQIHPTHHTLQNTYNQHASHTSYATHMTHATHTMHTSHSTTTALSAQTEETRAPPPHPPKSILKTNRPEVTNGYAADMQQQDDSSSRVSELTSGLASASVSSVASAASGGGPPAPPERGSSFAVMAGRRAMSPPHPPHPTHPPHSLHQQQQQDVPPPHSPVGAARDKRVSFHERAAAPVPGAPASPVPGAADPAPAASPAPPAPPASSPPPLDPPLREDPDRFIEEAENMMAGGASPATLTPSLAAHTPGVIGAQEVYRDPRMRRLAEQQARAAAAPVPEHLSFKEKMKMFALESGEASTPKDKVKISRAQRDIDAVR